MGRFSRRRLLAGAVVGGPLAVGGCAPVGGNAPARPLTQEIVVWLQSCVTEGTIKRQEILELVNQ